MLYEIFRVFGVIMGYPLQFLFFKRKTYYENKEKTNLKTGGKLIVANHYNMFDYVNFLCAWPSYYMNFESGEDYLYPSDAIYFIETDGAQFNYGYKSGYFEGIINQIKSVNPTAFSDLIAMIEDAKDLADSGYLELKNGNYTEVNEYGNRYNDGRGQYRLNKHDELKSNMDQIYSEFSIWLSSWEL